ncbi:MAG: P-loop containing nucleoside triphosphate hydrolase protein [Monoraphidium minutum]|nr:MAG: P-loop containing nucleoside triphosphate hydrolase protein [Monoraphidium minutum]
MSDNNTGQMALGLASAAAGAAALAALWQARSCSRPVGMSDLDAESRGVLDAARALQRAAGAAAVHPEHVKEALEAVAKLRGGGGGEGGDGNLTKEELEETMKKMLAPPGGLGEGESALERFTRDPPGGLGEGESALERFTRDVTADARRARLDPLVGRDAELRRVSHILLRRTKNNPVLVGESGVGKTAIAEGLAQRIVAGDVPPGLMGFAVLELDLPSLAAGCMMPGEFEERLKAVVTEIEESGRRIILFIDDIHNLVPSATQAGGAMSDGSAILKPALAKGTLRCLGCSSPDKFKKTVERDPALERRFQLVTVDQPGVDATTSILRGLRPRYEAYHGITISEGALVAAATLSARYISGRHLPDKAIDCLDEAAAQVKMEAALAPELLDSLERQVRALEAEETQLERRAGGGRGGRYGGAAAGRSDPVAAACLEEVRDRLEAVRSEVGALRHAFKEGREAAAAVRAAREAVSRLRFELSPEYRRMRSAGYEPVTGPVTDANRPKLTPAMAMAMLGGNGGGAYDDENEDEEEDGGEDGGGGGDQANGHANGHVGESAAEREDAAWAAAKEEELAAALESLGAAEAAAAAVAGAGGARGGGGEHEVEEGDVARVISKWTGIPISKLVSTEREKLLSIGAHLHRRIIGQGDAVDAVATAIQRSRADLSDPNGPIASFMFLGPTGVGKTELAKALAAFMFNAEDALTRIDMSEYMEKHSVSRLIGAPPGYVGYEEGGLLTDAVRRKPYSVVLLDEVEKAHADVFNVLLQILDDGRVTDSQGRTVSFKNCVIIMTSNLGSGEIFAHLPSDSREALQGRVMDAVRGHFRPEFINRVDEFIVFEPLTQPEIRDIVGLKSAALAGRLAAQRIGLVLTDSALDYLADKGFDPVYGARPVKRALQRELQTRLAQALLRGEFSEGDTVRVEAAPGGDGLALIREGPAGKESGGGGGGGGESSGRVAAAAAAPAAAKPKQRRVVVSKVKKVPAAKDDA